MPTLSESNMAELTNEEIRQKLLKFNYDCGPVTDTTREILLKKLKSLNNSPGDKKHDVGLSDEELRSQLVSYGVSVAPITSTNRHIYLKRLETLKKSAGNAKQKVKEFGESYDDEWEPMEID